MESAPLNFDPVNVTVSLGAVWTDLYVNSAEPLLAAVLPSKVVPRIDSLTSESVEACSTYIAPPRIEAAKLLRNVQPLADRAVSLQL